MTQMDIENRGLWRRERGVKRSEEPRLAFFILCLPQKAIVLIA